ncbi:hypothetical protein ABZP36_001031 [Zizania latifolia]
MLRPSSIESAAEVANPTGSAGVVVPGLVQEQEQEPQEAGAQECCQKIRSLAASCKQLKKKGKACPTSDIAASACETGKLRISKRLRRTRAGHAPSARTSATAASACEPRKLMLYWSWVITDFFVVFRGDGFWFVGRKKKGLQPTGALAHTAKASGCGSVHELLGKGSEVVAELQKSSQKARSASLKVRDAQKAQFFSDADLTFLLLFCNSATTSLPFLSNSYTNPHPEAFAVWASALMGCKPFFFLPTNQNPSPLTTTKKSVITHDQ